jgi:phosphoglycolate phosphatase
MLEVLSLPVAGENRVRKWIGDGTHKLVVRALAHATGSTISHLDEQLVENGYQHFIVYYAEHHSVKSHLFPGVSDALAHWHTQGLQLAVVTNKPARFVVPILEAHNIDSYFDAFVGGDTTTEKKPSATPVLHACELLGLPVPHCIMIGDSRHDVVAARNANMVVACVTGGYNHGEPIKDSSPDMVASTLPELSEFVLSGR